MEETISESQVQEFIDANQEEAPQEEAPQVEETPQEEEKTPDQQRLHAAFDELNRREAEVRKKEFDLKENEKKVSEFSDLKALAQEDPLKFFESVGTSYEDITNRILEEPETQTVENQQIRKLQEQVDQLLEQTKRQQTENEQKTNQEHVNDHITTVRGYLDTNTDQFELVNLNWDAAKDIYLSVQSQYANKMLKDFGKAELLPHSEVLENIEKYYEQQFQILSNSNKFKSNSRAAESPQFKPAPSLGKQTLKNSSSRITSAAQEESDENLTEQERLERAVKILKAAQA